MSKDRYTSPPSRAWMVVRGVSTEVASSCSKPRARSAVTPHGPSIKLGVRGRPHVLGLTLFGSFWLKIVVIGAWDLCARARLE